MNKETKLLPCPFCGGEASVMIGEVCFNTLQYLVRCNNCHVETPRFATGAGAIAAWNKRDYLPEEIQARLRKLGYYEEEAGGASVAYLLAENRDLRKALVAVKNAAGSFSKNSNNSVCKENLQTKLTYADVEKMVKPLEWELQCEGGDFVARVGNALFRIYYWDDEEKYIVFCNTTIIEGGFTLLQDAKQAAQQWLVDLVAAALGVERGE